MKVEQYVMAYLVEHDRLRAIIPAGFTSIRPVLRINAEIRDDSTGYIEFNTAVERDGVKGWLNISFWNEVPFKKEGKKTEFNTDFLDVVFTGAGIEGSCPAEKNNAGCFFLHGAEPFRKTEVITANKEFCDCAFRWKFTDGDAHGESLGKTLPAYPQEITTVYPGKPFTAESAASIPCKQVLGTYKVTFER